MPGVERHRGLPVPRLGTVCLLASAISACWVAWVEIDPVVDSAAPSLQPVDPYEHLRSIDEIVENDPDAAARLVGLLSDDDPRTRADALIGLSRLGGAASQTVEAVRDRLSDEVPAVRNHALAAFARVVRTGARCARSRRAIWAARRRSATRRPASCESTDATRFQRLPKC